MKLAAVLLALAVALLQLGSVLADEAPDLSIITTFPDNPFSLVQNGQANRVVFSISKPAHLDRVLAIESITGAFLHPRKADGQTGRVLRNMSTLTLRSLPLHNVGGQPMQLPFDFYPEFKPQDMGVEFRMKVRDEQTNKVFDMELYRGTVTVQEPPFAFWDVQLLSVYVLFAALVAGAGYWAYKTYVPAKLRRKVPAQPQRQPADKKKGDAAPSSSAKKGDAKAPTYDEEWIPTHHLRPRKQRARRG